MDNRNDLLFSADPSGIPGRVSITSARAIRVTQIVAPFSTPIEFITTCNLGVIMRRKVLLVGPYHALRVSLCVYVIISCEIDIDTQTAP